MEEVYRIRIAGLERYIASYEHILFKEPGNLEFGSGPITPHQYYSCLFNNLGYDKCPPDKLWIERGIDVEDVQKTESFDYPITNHPLMLKNNYTLFSFLMCVRNWIRGGYERGHLLDPFKSFKLPSPKEIEFNLQNRVKIVRNFVVKNKIDCWDKVDVFWRRLYNLNPNVDKEYFENSIVNFESYSKQITIPDPIPIFIATLINPDILLSVIKQAEIEACKTVLSRADHRMSVALLNEKDIVIEFERILLFKLSKIATIYHNSGPLGFLQDKYKLIKMIPSQITVGNEVQLIHPILLYGRNDIPPDQIVLAEVFHNIASIPFDGETKEVVTKYIEPHSLLFLDKWGIDNQYRIATYKRLYYTIEQLKNCNPELISSRDKFVLSESFYIDPDRFGLYSKFTNKFYIASLDLILREMTPQEAVEYYENYLGRVVMLDGSEIGNALEPDPVPYIDLDMLERQSMGLLGQNITEPAQFQQCPSNPNVYQTPIQILPNQALREVYGFNLQNVVEGMY